MEPFETHIINKVFFEVNTFSKRKGYYLKDNLDTFLKEELFPLLEMYFNAIDKKMPQKSIQIEKLNLDISTNPDIDFTTMKREILEQIQKQMGWQIETDFQDTKNYTVVEDKEKELNKFFSFLETGTNAWWVVSKNTIENKENQFGKMISENAFVTKLLNALKNSKNRNRFIKQLSNDQIFTLLEKAFRLELTEETTSKKIRRIKENLNTVTFSSQPGLFRRNLIWEIILSKLADHNQNGLKEKLVSLINSFSSVKKYNSELVLKAIHHQIQNKPVLDILLNLEDEVLTITAILEQKASEIVQNKKDKFLESELPKTNQLPVSGDKIAKETDSILNNNEDKGMPDSALFLKEKTVPDTSDKQILDALSTLDKEIVLESASDYYTNNAGLILIHPFLKQLFDNCNLLNKDKTILDPETAAHLLHYIATNQEQDYENEMLVEKFLCNIPINQAINRNIILSKELKKQANEMLQAVLENWHIMKNSSVALLQNEYLQRPGKIMLTADNPKILVERKTQDILLDTISWNLGIVKLAWKSKIIFVEW